jgi:translation initiation factor IF-3
VRVVGSEGDQIGVMGIKGRIGPGRGRGLDLVEIAPQADPPVCRIMDWGKFRFESPRSRRRPRKKQKQIQIKEVKFRPNTETHDYDVKMRNLRRFIEEGNKVKVTLRFRGREMAHQELGRDLLKRVENDMAKNCRGAASTHGRSPDGDDAVTEERPDPGTCPWVPTQQPGQRARATTRRNAAKKCLSKRNRGPLHEGKRTGEQ